MSPKPTDVRILEVTTTTEQHPYRTPIKFGGRIVTDALILGVTIEVETRSGLRGVGFGSMPMGNAWGWPSRTASGEQTLTAMTQLGERIARLASDYQGSAHPLRIAEDLRPQFASAAAEITSSLDIEPMPALAQLLSGSPVDAALHDAYGRAHERSSYDLLGQEFVDADLSHYLNADFRGEYLDRYTLRTPKPRMPLYHLVGALDPLIGGDVTQPIGDGLPEHLGEWIAADGLTHLKIKLAGDDLAWDADRVLAVERVAAEAQARRGVSQWWYSVDFNERCASVEYVLDFLQRVAAGSAAAHARIQYIEQPTHRDLRANPDNRMHRAAELKPVVIDESLIDLESLLLARELGYSGAALKACKGHSEALLMGAAAQKYGMFLCVQDLTCTGANFLHSASLAARIPTVAAIEGNGRQYCPAANEPWRERFPGMFDITDGSVATSCLGGKGLGY